MLMQAGGGETQPECSTTLWRKGWGFQVGTWNVDSLTGRAGELIETLADKEVDVACIQET